MNALRSYFRPAAGPNATDSKPANNNDKVPPLGAASRGTAVPHELNVLSASPGPSTPYHTGSGPSTPYHTGSRPVSVHPDGDFRNNSPQDVDEIKNAIAINWVYQVQNENMWNGNSGFEGVVLRKAPRQFIACPNELVSERGGLFDAASELNAKVSHQGNSLSFMLLIFQKISITVNTRVIRLVVERTRHVTITLQDGLRVQILPSIKFLATCQKHQNAAFIKDQGLLVVWADSPREVITQAKDIERQMMHVFARSLDPYDEKSPEKEGHTVHVTEKASGGSDLDSEKMSREDGLTEDPRRIVLNQAILCALTLILIIAALGSGWRQIAIEIKVDHNWTRLLFILVMPLQIWLALVRVK